MEKKTNKGLIVLIVILIVLLLASVSYICYDKFVNKDTKPKEETGKQEELVKENSFKLEDIECTGTQTCTKTVKLAYNNKNHEVKLLKKSSSNQKFTIEVYIDNNLIDTLDGGQPEEIINDTKLNQMINELDGYIYVLDGKYLAIVYRYEGAKPSWYLKFYNETTPSEEKPILVASYGSSRVKDDKDLTDISSLEFNGTSIKYWDIYCNGSNDEDQISAAQYEVAFDGTKITTKVGEILNDVEGGGQSRDCPDIQNNN